MLLGQFFLLSFIIFSFLFVMSLVRRDGKAIRNLVIAGISFIVFFVIVSPDNDENKTIKEDDPIKIETNEDDIEEINENKELTQAEGPIPDPITYDGSGDDVIDIEKTEEGPVVLFIKGNQNEDQKHFTIQGYDNDDKKTNLFVNTPDPYEGYTLDAAGTTSLVGINASGAWKLETHSLRSMERIESPSKFKGTGDEIFLIEDDISRATIEGNNNPAVSSPHLKIIGHQPSVETDKFHTYSLLNTTDKNYQGTVKTDNFIGILTIETEGPWSIDLK